MKNIKLIVLMLLSLIVVSCEDDDATITQVVQNEVERGAVLRTLDLISSTFNAFDPTSTFDVIIQEQDIEDGGLMESVDVFLSFQKPGASGFDTVVSERLLENIPASAFTIDEFGLPQTRITLTLQEATSFLGLETGDFTGGDRVVVRLALNLTDGRIISFQDAAGNVLSSSFFQSPYRYFVDIACIPLGPVPGDYIFEMVDSYGDGWNGGFLTVTVDGVSQDISVPEPNSSTASVTITVPEGTTEFTVVYTGGSFDDENSFEIILNGVVVASASNPPDGEVILSICPT
ncbi:MAG: hypothetical protein RQ735_05680 [Flavobacteriaceae bacterium]|nr:hypothetical protein [Flavobacteriaceae bacterium]